MYKQRGRHICCAREKSRREEIPERVINWDWLPVGCLSRRHLWQQGYITGGWWIYHLSTCHRRGGVRREPLKRVPQHRNILYCSSRRQCHRTGRGQLGHRCGHQGLEQKHRPQLATRGDGNRRGGASSRRHHTRNHTESDGGETSIKPESPPHKQRVEATAAAASARRAAEAALRASTAASNKAF